MTQGHIVAQTRVREISVHLTASTPVNIMVEIARVRLIAGTDIRAQRQLQGLHPIVTIHIGPCHRLTRVVVIVTTAH